VSAGSISGTALKVAGVASSFTIYLTAPVTLSLAVAWFIAG
jgi:hypothetical protein